MYKSMGKISRTARRRIFIGISVTILILILWLYSIDRVAIIIFTSYLKNNIMPPTMAPPQNAHNWNREILSSDNNSEREKIKYPDFVDLTSLPSDDDHRLINLTDFKYLITQKPCSVDTQLVLMVHSAFPNHQRRKMVRETWGYPDPRGRVLFLFGTVSSEADQIELEQEAIIHGDIIQGNFVDSYHNLSYKHVMVLKWAVHNCPNAKYVLKADDDILINTPAAYDYFEKFDARKLENQLYCVRSPHQPILRDKNSKWYVSEDDFPGEHYPTYCSGYSIVYPMKSAFKIYRAGQNETRVSLWVDDAYVSGVLAAKANIEITNFDDYRNVSLHDAQYRELVNMENVEKNLNFIFTIQAPKPQEIRHIWKLIYDKYHYRVIYPVREKS